MLKIVKDDGNLEEPVAKAPKKETESDRLWDAVKKNEENKKRMEEERKKANKGVIRSYRLKN